MFSSTQICLNIQHAHKGLPPQSCGKRRYRSAVSIYPRHSRNMSRCLRIFTATNRFCTRSIIDGKYAKALIAYEEDVPVGFMVYYYSFSTFECRPGIHLEDLFIHKEYRGKGYGKLMLTYLANEAVKNGFTRLEWTCLNWNAPSIEFYEKLGARNMCEWRTYRLSGKELMENADFYFGHCTTVPRKADHSFHLPEAKI